MEPWTHTLGSDREYNLQMLQSSLYCEIQRLFSEKKGLVFANRFDELFAITNGFSLDDHIEIQKKLKVFFDLEISMAIGCGKSPFDANIDAHNMREHNVILDAEHRICGSLYRHQGDTKIQIMHMDIEGITEMCSIKSPYEISSLIIDLHNDMSKFFLAKKSLTFFMDGDNFMILSDKNSDDDAREFVDLIKQKYGITLNCGIGTASTAKLAVTLATESLDGIRKLRDGGRPHTCLVSQIC